jgi:hypothetical protein
MANVEFDCNRLEEDSETIGGTEGDKRSDEAGKTTTQARAESSPGLDRLKIRGFCDKFRPHKEQFPESAPKSHSCA